MIEIESDKIESFKEIVENSKRIVIVPHLNPDGDAIGSSFALRRVLRNMGKIADVIVPNEFPEFLKWIDGSDQAYDYSKDTDRSRKLFFQADTLFCLDFNDPNRSEGMRKLLRTYTGPSVLIDHHLDPAISCSVIFSYPKASSTCELLYRVLEQAGYDKYIDKDGAESIFAGIATDTGNFSYNSSDPDTFRIVAKLLEKGINKDRINSNLYHTFSSDRWRLIGHALKDKMVILPKYRTGYICLSKEELDQFNFQPGDTEGLVNYPLMVKGIVFCVLITEKENKIKMSFRSKGTFSVNQFSRDNFNGGGHINAAGGESPLSLKETEQKLIELLPQYKEALLNSF